MVGMSSVLPPAQRGSGVRPVRPVAGPASGPASGRPKSDRPEASVRGPKQDRTAWRDRKQIDGDGFIDAEFVEVLREASASATVSIGPADETLRQAIEAYRRAAGFRSILGAMIDVPI